MLPPGWRRELSPGQVAAVLEFEVAVDRGELALRGPDARGYWWVYLPDGHPFSNGRGRMQRLHRYVVMRARGRRLPWYFHVHHPKGVPRDCRDASRLEVLEETCHGRWHYGVRLSCGQHIPADDWQPRDRCGRFTPLPLEATG